MFSVASESSPNLPVRSEPPRFSSQNAPSQSNGFAALVDGNTQSSTEPSPPATTDRRDPPQASARRQDSEPAREATPDATTTPADSSPNAERTTPGESSRHAAGKPPKQIKDGKVSDDSVDAHSDQASDTDPATTSAPDISPDPVAVAGAAVPVPPAVATSTPASPTTAGSTTTSPLSIAAAAIASSAQASAMPTASADDTSPIVEAVADAASEVNATNFTIAKTIATTPVPATGLEAEAQPAAAPELASAVTAAALKVIKSSDKLPAAHMDAAAEVTSAESASQPSSPIAAPPSVTQAGTGAAQPNPHPPSSAGTDPASASSSSADPKDSLATPAGDRHHAAAVPSQPQSTTPDVISQLGTPLATPQTAAATAVPAAQLTATAAVNLPDPISGLAVQIAATARAGNSRFEIRLDPAELGRIDVRLDVDRNGQVRSHLTVEKPETLAMLRQDAPQLQRALEDAGLKTGQNGLQFSLRDQSSGNQNNSNTERQPQSQRLVISDAAVTAPLVAVSTTYSYAAGASRGLDIRV